MKPSWCRRRRRAARLGFWWQAALCLHSLAGCGYHSLASATAGAENLCVLAAPAKVPDFGAIQGALDGAREELSRHSALGESGVYPCLVIELLRVDEAPAGIVAGELDPGGPPRARGTNTALVGRAWVQHGPSAPFSRDTGDMRRVTRLQASNGPLEGTRHDRGLEQAGQALGRDLARRVLGLPTPSDEPP